MNCKICLSSLKCEFGIETKKEEMPVRIVYQWWKCSCGARYFGILEESKVNIFDDRLEHSGYFAEEMAWNESLKKAKKCPKPRDPDCQSQVHAQMPFPEFSGKQAWYSYE